MTNSAILQACFLLTAVPAWADVPGPTVEFGPNVLASLKAGPKMVATGVDLRGTTFLGLDLSGAVFDGCDLDSVTFSHCNLSGASFKNANLRGSRFVHNSLFEADFSGARVNGIKNLRDRPHFYLTENQLKSTWSFQHRDLSECVISAYEVSEKGAFGGGEPELDFTGFDLRNSVFDGGNFSKCVFLNSRLEGSVFQQASVAAEQLASTTTYKSKSLFGIRFTRRNGISGNLSLAEIDLKGSKLYVQEDSDLRDARISGAELHGLSLAQLKESYDYREGSILNTVFTRGRFKNANFHGVNLSGCCFKGCVLDGANFDSAVVTGVRFLLSQGQFDLTKTWNSQHDRSGATILKWPPE